VRGEQGKLESLVTSLQQYWWLVPLGFGAGIYGTLIGAGGGFVLAPLLLILYPQDNPENITSISLAVVFFNALAGSFAYGRAKRIDYRSGLLFSAATIPGSMLGAFSTAYLSRPLFNAILGLMMIGGSVFLLLPHKSSKKHDYDCATSHATRLVIDAKGIRHVYAYNSKLAVTISAFVGYVSSLLGIGGGIIHVPVLVQLLNFPVHIATATSHFVLAIMAFTGTAVHVATGAFTHGIRRTTTLAIGVILGAPLGARISQRVHGPWIIRGLALALGFVGVRILILGFWA